MGSWAFVYSMEKVFYYEDTDRRTKLEWHMKERGRTIITKKTYKVLILRNNFILIEYIFQMSYTTVCMILNRTFKYFLISICR